MSSNDLTFSRRGFIRDRRGRRRAAAAGGVHGRARHQPRRQPRRASGSAGASREAGQRATDLHRRAPAARSPTFPPPARSTRTASSPIPRTRSRRCRPRRLAWAARCCPTPTTALPRRPLRSSRTRPGKTVNKELNADVQFTIIAQADYLTKLATVMAGNDLPDVMLIPGASASGAAQVQDLTQFLEAQGADLTPYPGRRRGQGLSQPGGHSDVRLEELRLRAQRQAVHAADRALLPGQHAAEELGGLRPGDRQGLRAQERRRLQARPPAAQPSRHRTSGPSARTSTRCTTSISSPRCSARPTTGRSIPAAS